MVPRQNPPAAAPMARFRDSLTGFLLLYCREARERKGSPSEVSPLEIDHLRTATVPTRLGPSPLTLYRGTLVSIYPSIQASSARPLSIPTCPILRLAAEGREKLALPSTVTEKSPRDQLATAAALLLKEKSAGAKTPSPGNIKSANSLDGAYLSHRRMGS